MSSNKKDLTRIEDLGSFTHELDEESTDLNSDAFGSEELPPLDSTEDAPAFDTDSFSSDTGVTFESEDPFTLKESSGTFSLPEESAEFPEELPSDSGFKEETLPEFTPEAFPELDERPVNFEATETKTRIELPETPSPVPEEAFKTPETFADLRRFAESTSFTGMSTEGNPSFSVLIRDVRFLEDVNDIISLLRDLTLLTDPEEQVKGRLMRGQLLVPRISEYAAILLAHKLRRFDIDIQVGLSDEIHPPKHQETPETGMVSKHSLYQNSVHHFSFQDSKVDVTQVLLTSTSTLEGFQILKYQGIASEHKILEGHVVEDETSPEIPLHYQDLAQKLKAHALKAHANAVVGLNYQLTPLPTEFGITQHKYRLTCTGNLVWVNKL